MIDFQTLLILAAMMAGFSLKPGPGMLAFASRAISERGMMGVGAFMLGNAPVKALFLLMVIFGFHRLGDLQVFILIMIKAMAAVYLIWLGIKGLQKDMDSFADKLKPKKAEGFMDDFLAGFVITITNPFDIIIFASVLPTLLNLNTIGFGDFWAIYAALMVAYFGVVLSYTIPLSFGRKFLSEKGLIWLNRISNAVMILIGLIIGFSALFSSTLLPG